MQKQRKPNKYLIVGIDPGSTAGISALDLNGKPVFVESIRSSSKGEIIKKILKHGKPLIVASDVSPPPKTLAKISSLLKAKLYVPPSDISSEEKRCLVQNYFGCVKMSDQHKKDASAAAAKAYISYRRALSKAEKYIGKEKTPEIIERVKADVIRGTPIKTSLKRQREKKTRAEVAKVKVKGKVKSSKESLEPIKKIQELKEEKENREAILLKKIHSLEEQIEILKRNFKAEIAKDRKIAELKHRIRVLQQINREIEMKWRVLKEVRSKETYDNYFAPIISKAKDVQKLKDHMEIREDEIILVKSKSKDEELRLMKYLKKTKVKGMVVENKERINVNVLQELTKENKFVLDVNEVKILEKTPQGVYLDRKSLIEAIKREEKRTEELKLEKQRETLINLINEYKMRGILS